MQRIPSPKKRLRPLFGLLVEVTATVDRTLAATPLPANGTSRHLTMFDLSILMRGNNALKSVRILCEQAHWEMACGIVRQIFELVLNMEYLGNQADRKKQAFLYVKFGVLQHMQTQQKELDYARKTGRPYDTERLDFVDEFINTHFDEFRSGSGKLWNTWSGKPVRQLAELSKSTLRLTEYDMLFAKWSEEAHGAPVALLPSIFPQQIPIPKLVASNDHEIAQLIALSLRFFLELWTLLPYGPKLDPSPVAKWTTLLARLTNTGGTARMASKHGPH